MYTGSTRRISEFSVSHVCTASTACTRGYVPLILPVLAVFGPSVLLILKVLGCQYCNTCSTRSTKCTRYSHVYSEYEVAGRPGVSMQQSSYCHSGTDCCCCQSYIHQVPPWYVYSSSINSTWYSTRGHPVIPGTCTLHILPVTRHE